jgi:hypothetical protein
MNATADSHPIWLGLKLYELLTLAGIVVGPIAAVIITLATERWRKGRDERIQTLRLLLSTRATPSDPKWNHAIALVPVEFRNSKIIIEKWKAYLSSANAVSTPEQDGVVGRRTFVAQNAMISAIAKSLGIDLSEGDVETTAYISRGSTERDAMVVNALKGVADIAAATTRTATSSEALIQRLGPPSD